MDDSQDFQFILPLKNGDLLNSRGDQYYVQQIYTPNEIPDQLLGKSKMNASVWRHRHFSAQYIFRANYVAVSRG